MNKQVVLDEAGSHDANGDTLNYRWDLLSQPLGSYVTLSDANTVNPSLIPNIIGNYVVQLIVDDNQLYSESDTVLIGVE